MLIDSSWDRFANTDPKFFISTRFGKNDAEFWKSGERTAQLLLERVKPFLHSFERVLDFGAGIGRIAIPMSKAFKEIRAVDISPRMLELLKQHCAQSQISNIKAYRDDEEWDDTPIDFAFSVLTFQHIPGWSQMEHSIMRIAKCLSGVAYFQFDTRAPNFWYTIKTSMPDILVPTTWKHGMRRIRREPKILRTLFAKCGLEIVKEFDPDSPLHGFLLRKVI